MFLVCILKCLGNQNKETRAFSFYSRSEKKRNTANTPLFPRHGLGSFPEYAPATWTAGPGWPRGGQGVAKEQQTQSWDVYTVEGEASSVSNGAMGR